jgi:hypothetical protein
MVSNDVCCNMLCFFLYAIGGTILAIAQSPEAGHIERAGNQATLTVDGP